MTIIQNRYDFLLLFDVQDGNPNGNPDAGNQPRFDAQTRNGLVTDVCIKRKLRNFVELTMGQAPGFEIFVKEKAVLNRSIAEAHEDEGVKAKDPKKRSEAAREVLCRRFYDIRTFGAVLSTGEKEKNAGQVRGPVQITFSRSIDPIFSQDFTVTRMAVTNEKDEDKERTMGRKANVPYALYKGHGFVSPALANQTGFDQTDLDLLWKGLLEMFEHDRSAARGLMSTRALFVFQHESALGNARAQRLFDCIQVAKRPEVHGEPRRFEDYEVQVNEEQIPKGVKLLQLHI